MFLAELLKDFSKNEEEIKSLVNPEIFQFLKEKENA